MYIYIFVRVYLCVCRMGDIGSNYEASLSQHPFLPNLYAIAVVIAFDPEKSSLLSRVLFADSLTV